MRPAVSAARGIGASLSKDGFVAHDANVLFRANCPNIDLVVFGKDAAIYIQVKSSQKPAGSDAVIKGGRFNKKARAQRPGFSGIRE
jgi:hypothetical protein